jgi:hypothetical protein
VLRRALLVVGVAGLLLGVLFLLAGAVPAALELFIACGLLTAGILFERWHYVRSANTRGHWEATKERFVDTTTGKLIQVYYNPETGERDYRTVGEETAGQPPGG